MTVTLHINDQTLESPHGDSLFDCAERVEVRVPTSCHKNGKCRECLVEVIVGMSLLSPLTDEEQHLQDGFRLSCRARVVGDSGVVRCHTMHRGRMRILDRLENMPSKTSTVDTLDPAVRRDGNDIRLDGEVIAQATGTIHGLAVDLGTTTVVVNLVDLESGETVATSSFENPQRFGGSDVMARIKYDTDHPGKLLQRTLLGYLTHAIEDLPCEVDTIYEMVVAGNPTMRDLFFGLDVFTIGQRPYRSLTEHEMLNGQRDSTQLTVPVKRLRLPMNANARIQGLPLVGCHVGADTTACLLAIDLMHEDRTVVLMDIGTNTELIVGNKERVLAASCPAGPAFEGGGVTCGMPGLDGAIENVRIGPQGEVTLRVIGDLPPEGVCGSGLVEALSELLRTRRMNRFGRFADDQNRFTLDADHNIHLREEDISQLAQAKGANIAGLRIVLSRYGIDFADIDRFYLAGGFAHHLDLDAARRIGMIPDLANDVFVPIGNASLAGATEALKSVSRRSEVEQFVRQIEHVELETDPRFFDYFVFGCQYEPVQTRVIPT